MNKLETIVYRLEKARGAVQRAADAFDRDDAVALDLRAIEAEVDLAAAAATDLGEDAPAPARQALLNLVADLNGLQRRIAEGHRNAAAALGQTAASRRAVAAYGRPTSAGA